MKLLLDTHTLLWWLFDDPQLSESVRKAVATADNRILVSSASAWELATKYRIGKLPEAGNIVEKLPHYLRKERFEVLPISLEHALKAGLLPGPHRDPFDRMLMAQSEIEKIPVATIDPVFTQYGVRVVW